MCVCVRTRAHTRVCFDWVLLLRFVTGSSLEKLHIKEYIVINIVIERSYPTHVRYKRLTSTLLHYVTQLDPIIYSCNQTLYLHRRFNTLPPGNLISSSTHVSVVDE